MDVNWGKQKFATLAECWLKMIAFEIIRRRPEIKPNFIPQNTMETGIFTNEV